MTTNRTVASVIVISAMVLIATAEELHLSEEYPTKGVPTTIIVRSDTGDPIAGLLVKAIYSPNASASITVMDSVGVSDEIGQVVWTPHTEGIVMLQAIESERSTGGELQETIMAQKNVSVKFAGIPPSGVFIFLFAGSILFGGIIFAYRKLVT